MGKGGGGIRKGGVRGSAPASLADLLADLEKCHETAGKAALAAHGVAAAMGAHALAAGLAAAGAHAGAASRYDGAATALARSMEPSACRGLHKAYSRRVVSLLGRSASLSARAQRAIARLPRPVFEDDHAPGDGKALADAVRGLDDAMAQIDHMTGRIVRIVRRDLAGGADLAAALERTGRGADLAAAPRGRPSARLDSRGPGAAKGRREDRSRPPPGPPAR